MSELTPEAWCAEARRLCAALDANSYAAATSEIALSHKGLLASDGKTKLVWMASCPGCRVEASSASAAMQALLAKLSAQLDEVISEQKATLERLQEARTRGLKIVGGE